jgi:hypothetical protein
MTDNIQNQNGTELQSNSFEPKPVKNRYTKIIHIGTRIAVSGAIIAVVANYIFSPRVQGTTRSARLRYEQKRLEIQRQLEEEIQKEIDEKE